jgi:hypothetical protein
MSPQYSLNRRLGGPQNQSGRCGREKDLVPTGTWTATPQPSSPQPVTILTMLSQCFNYHKHIKTRLQAHFLRGGLKPHMLCVLHTWNIFIIVKRTWLIWDHSKSPPFNTSITDTIHFRSYKFITRIFIKKELQLLMHASLTLCGSFIPHGCITSHFCYSFSFTVFNFHLKVRNSSSIPFSSAVYDCSDSGSQFHYFLHLHFKIKNMH